MFKKSLGLSLLLLTTLNPAGNAFADDNGGRAPAVPVGSLAANHGQVLCTAGINADGTVGGGLHVLRDPTKTFKLSTGNYQVLFGVPCNNITAAKGWARWLQVDTLTTGSIFGVSCTTADRAGAINGVFVQCVNHAGALTDTSFFLFVAR